MTDPQDLVKRQFGVHAASYVTSRVHAHGESLARLTTLTQPQRHWVVLDVSTGAGHTALAFAPRVSRVVATDLTPEMLDAARRLSTEREMRNVQFASADAHGLPFGERTFDLVTNRIALHHYPDARGAVSEMARVCKRGGIVSLVDNVVPPDDQVAAYLNQFERLRDPSHHCAHPVRHLEAFFADAGLIVEHHECLKKEMEFAPWATRMGAGQEMVTKLERLLREAPDGVREVLVPRLDEGGLFFTLTEAVMIGRKQ